ncbi:MAG: site-specific integrase [Eubacteriales bacterium]|nr:site-specific integrase [Eubacteriales bacterium]
MPKKSLKRRKDGRYLCWYKEVPFYGHTSDEALEARDEYKRREKEGTLLEAYGPTILQYATKWIRVYKAEVGVRTYNDYAHYLNILCKTYGEAHLRDITATDIKELYNTQMGKSGSHIRKFAMIIRSMFAAAVDDGYINRNPCVNVKRPAGEDGTHRALEPWEISLIQSMVGRHPFAPAVMAMLYGGLRRGEALALNIDTDVDFNNSIIHVKEALAFNSNQPTRKCPKSAAGIREVPLFDPLRNAIEGKHGLLVTRQSGCEETSGTYLSESAFQSLWSSYKTALEYQLNGCHKRWYGHTRAHKNLIAEGGKLPPWKEINIRTHDFRHTYCTMLYNADVDIKTAMKWMGHADEKMILKIYAHLSEDKEKRAARAVGELLNKQLNSQNDSQT